MADNFKYVYLSGASIVLKATEDSSAVPSVYTPHVNADLVSGAKVIISDGIDDISINDDGTLNVSTAGGESVTGTSGLLERMLKELKIMNLHLSLMTDMQITKQEVE